jgi:hypothetical protein
MQIDERIWFISRDVVEDQLNVTDPVSLAEPWKFSWKCVRKPKYKVLEYVCESNHYPNKAEGFRIGERLTAPMRVSGAIRLSADPIAERGERRPVSGIYWSARTEQMAAIAGASFFLFFK